MNYENVLSQAREVLSPLCLVCKECNGFACRGRVPGVGGKGTGSSFIRNVEYLKTVHLVLDTVYENQGQDTSIALFNRTFEAPIFIAPIGAIDINYGGLLSEEEYHRRCLVGAKASGIAAFTGDGPKEEYFSGPLKPLRDIEGWGIPTLKPWSHEKIIEKIKMAEEAKAMALAMDIDSAGLVHLAASGKPVFAKSPEELRRISKSTSLPFLIKGIMSAKAAKKVLDTGAYGLVVSNHGGRVLEDTPATTEVLSEIKEVVGDRMKIFVDGGIRRGVDIFKALALGADAVLIGRPFAIAAMGGAERGVECLARKLIGELKDTMLMTGCRSLADIRSDKLSI